ncbi:MAG: class I SAM-dependent methyltransferase [Polyangiaceae bacterium]|nr:class I SAM-dependent methyltransferase [Polyangiaceae bacterium]
MLPARGTADPFEPHARALADFWRRGVSRPYLLETEDGERTLYAPEEYFSFGARSYALGAAALATARGRVWDVGAGAGRHSLILQKLGHEVVAFDRSASCVALMRERGVAQAVCRDAFELGDGEADTILMLDHGLGMAGTLDRLRELLALLCARLRPGGAILADGNDAAAARGERAGVRSVRAQLSYAHLRGPAFRWLWLDAPMLGALAARTGLVARELYRDERQSWLVRLERRAPTPG